MNNLPGPNELIQFAAQNGTRSLLDFSPMGLVKLFVSTISGIASFLMLKSAKRDQDVQRMIWGIVLALISIFTMF